MVLARASGIVKNHPGDSNDVYEGRKLFIKMEVLQIIQSRHLWGQKELATDFLINSFVFQSSR